MTLHVKSSENGTKVQRKLFFYQSKRLLDDVKSQSDISEKLEMIASIIQREDINWNEDLFNILCSKLSGFSELNLYGDPKISFENICKRIDASEKFKKFPKIKVKEALTHSSQRVAGVLGGRSIGSIGARGYHGGRA